ncbi:hypothetical protein D3C86_1984580 [compost metagenome]
MLLMSRVTLLASCTILPRFRKRFRSVVQLNLSLPLPGMLIRLNWISSPWFSVLPTLVKIELGMPVVGGRFCGKSRLLVFC